MALLLLLPLLLLLLLLLLLGPTLAMKSWYFILDTGVFVECGVKPRLEAEEGVRKRLMLFIQTAPLPFF